MPALTVDDLTVLPRLRAPGLGDTVRPVLSVTTAPSGYRGRGLPRTACVRRHRPGRPRPLRAHGPDGRGRLRTGRAQGHSLAPAPRLRDRHLHHRRRLRPPGQPGRRRHDHQRRHAVDDRGQPGCCTSRRRPSGWSPRAGCSTASSSGSTCRASRSGSTLATRTSARGQLGLTTTADAGALVRVIAGEVGGQAGPGSTHTPMAMLHASVAPGARLDVPWEVEFNALVYVLVRQRHRGPRASPHRNRPARGARCRRLRDGGR